MWVSRLPMFANFLISAVKGNRRTGTRSVRRRWPVRPRAALNNRRWWYWCILQPGIRWYAWVHQSHVPCIYKYILNAVKKRFNECKLYLKRSYLARYGHPDTLAVGNVVEVVRFGPRSHLRRIRAPELEIDWLFGNYLALSPARWERSISRKCL